MTTTTDIATLRAEVRRLSKLLHEAQIERDEYRARLAEAKRLPAQAQTVVDTARAFVANIDALDAP